MLNALLQGKLVADPEHRVGASGKPFATCRVTFAQDNAESALASVIGFGEVAERLMLLAKGDPVAIVGRASLNAWADKATGEPRAGLRIVAEQFLTLYQVQQRRKPKEAKAEGAQA